MKSEITKIKDSKVSKVIAGGSNGSIILLDLTKVEEKYVLYLYCTWRLSHKGKIITGSSDDPMSKDSFFVKELKKLENCLIKSIQLNEVGDFTLNFEDEKKLDVFCDLTSNGEIDDIVENWTICNISKNKCFSFTNYFTFYEECYSNSIE